jgi:ABC-type lipoprotein export system ATPase subunit
MLELRNMAKYFASESEIVHALTDISLTIQKTEFIAFMGSSVVRHWRVSWIR